jgi:hypothetical protein
MVGRAEIDFSGWRGIADAALRIMYEVPSQGSGFSGELPFAFGEGRQLQSRWKPIEALEAC